MAYSQGRMREQDWRGFPARSFSPTHSPPEMPPLDNSMKLQRRRLQFQDRSPGTGLLGPHSWDRTPGTAILGP
ncbi:hypothetical protein NQZ68_014264 [Dissostichus eleginoides]|nr:hypothetical protein NQZ68_014264 [Dissostichus eleginoides]